MRKIVVTGLVLSLILTTLFWQPVRAADRYVNGTTGIDAAGCGTLASPCATIQYTLNNIAASGDTVHVAAGTYNENVYIGWNNYSITIEGAGASSTTIDGGTGWALMTDCTSCNIIVRGFTMSSASNSDYGPVVYLDYGTGILENNEIFSRNSNTFTLHSGCVASYVANFDIVNNKIHHCDNGIDVWFLNQNTTFSRNEIYDIHRYGILINNGNVTITDNVIHDTGYDGMRVAASGTNGHTITNNTVSGGRIGITNACFGTPPCSSITNNIVTAHSMYGIYSYVSMTTYNNDSWGNGQNYYGPITVQNSISQDPLFIGGGDYHLQCPSPAVNAGTNSAPGIPTFDKDGNARISGWVVDMGAYETSCEVLTVTMAGAGSGTVTSNPAGMNCTSGTCMINFSPNSIVTLVATPSAGSSFAGWSGDSDCSDDQVTMDAAKFCTATFTLTPPSQQRRASTPSIAPLARTNISLGENLLTQVNDLFIQAKANNLDTATCEQLIDEAKKLLKLAKENNMTRPVYANNLALQAMKKLKEAIDCLKALLG